MTLHLMLGMQGCQLTNVLALSVNFLVPPKKRKQVDF